MKRDDRGRRHLPAAAADGDARHPRRRSSRSCSSCSPTTASTTSTSSSPTALHRRMTEAEMKRMVGDEDLRRLLPGPLLQPRRRGSRRDRRTSATTEHGEEVEHQPPRAPRATCVIYVNINLVPDGRRPQVGRRSACATTRACARTTTRRRCATRDSYMDPKRVDAAHAASSAWARVVDKHLNVFHIETTLNNRMFDGPLGVPGEERGRVHRVRPPEVRGACAGRCRRCRAAAQAQAVPRDPGAVRA